MKQVSPADFRLSEKIEWLFINNREKYPEYFLLKTGAKKIDSSKRGNVLYGISTHTTLVVQYPSGLVSADVVIKEKTYQEAMEEAENEMYEALEAIPWVAGSTAAEKMAHYSLLRRGVVLDHG